MSDTKKQKIPLEYVGCDFERWVYDTLGTPVDPVFLSLNQIRLMVDFQQMMMDTKDYRICGYIPLPEAIKLRKKWKNKYKEFMSRNLDL